MSSSFLQQKYAVQNATGHRSMGGSPQPNGIRAAIDPRFDTLLNRALVSGRSNQISPEVNTDISSSSTNSTAMLGAATQNMKKQPFLSPMCKHRLQGLLIGLLITVISITIVLAVLLTRSSSSSSSTASTVTSTVSPCDTLRWDPIGITLLGNGSSGSSLNQLNGPLGVFVDANDAVYVADSSNHRVLKVSSNGSGILVAGVTGVSTIGSSTLKNPSAVHVDSQQNLYIADTNNFRIQFWAHGASNGSTVAGNSNGVSGSTLNMLGVSYALYVDAAHNVYVSDGSNGRVVKWSSGAVTGVLVAGNGSTGYAPGQLAYPVGIVLDSQSNTLYISDYNSHTIVAWPAGAASGTIVAGLNSTTGNTPALLQNPWGITRDSYGNIYVADSSNSRIQMFCAVGSSFSSGTTIAGIGLAQLSSRGLYFPTGLALDSQMNLYVVDYGNHRVQKFLRIQ